VIEELIPTTFHDTGQYENNRCEADHGRLKARLRPMRGLKTDRTVSVMIRGHAFIQNLRRGHYELGVEASPMFRRQPHAHKRTPRPPWNRPRRQGFSPSACPTELCRWGLGG
jgi:hypothetical protein